MRRYVVMAVAMAVVVGVLGTVGPVSSQSPGQRTTLTFFDTRATDWEKDIDLGRKGDSPGDMNLFVDRLFDPETCEKAGNVLGRFQISKFVGKRDAWFVIDVTWRLPDGSLQTQHGGRFTDFMEPGTAVFPVTGGTGAYKDATGQLVLEEDVELCEKTGTRFTFDLAGVQ